MFENRRIILLENVVIEDLDVTFYIVGRWSIFL